MAGKGAGKGMGRLAREGSLLAYLIGYFLIGLEIFIMISPFAAYFYSVYSPLINFIYSNRYTSWTAEFFLPHLIFTGDPLMKAVGVLQPLLLFGGLGLFFYAAIPLYYAKFRRKGVVTKGIYCKVRHPQYLALGISGLGMLLYWPRLIILVTYITMLFVYYALARIEEREMTGKYGEGYISYMGSVPMFIPGNPGGRLFKVVFGSFGHKGAALAFLYVLALLGSVGFALLLRGYSVGSVPVDKYDGFTVVSVLPLDRPEAGETVEAALNACLKAGLDARRANVAYVLPTDFFMMGLLTEVGRSFPEGFEKPPIKSTVKKFLRIFAVYTEMQFGVYSGVHPLRRVIFVSVKDGQGRPLEGRDAFGLGARRYPVLYVDINKAGGHVYSVMEVEPRHEWGDVPMPIF